MVGEDNPAGIAAASDIWSSSDRERILAEVTHRLWLFTRRAALPARGRYRLVLQLTRLSDADLRRLRAIHYLIDPGLQRLLSEAVPDILRRMAAAKLPRIATTRGEIRGRIDWGRTAAERAACAAGIYEHDLYVYRTGQRSADIAPNRVLKALLVHTGSLAAEVLGTHFSLDSHFAAGYEAGWTQYAAETYTLCRNCLNSPELRAVSVPDTISGEMLLAARTARNPAYAEIERHYRHCIELTGEGGSALPEITEAVLREQILQPLDPDVMYELWIFFRTLDVLEEHGWQARRLRLVGSKEESGEPAVYRHAAGGEMRVFFQQLPREWRTLSAYTGIFEKYALGTAARRPDMILHWTAPSGAERFIIVEVKRSSNARYLADSAYKVLGYLKDFALAFADNPADGVQIPSAVLAVWENPGGFQALAPDRLPEDEVLLATCRSYTQQIGAILKQLARA